MVGLLESDRTRLMPQLLSRLTRQGSVTSGHGSCSTKYVRGREAVMAGFRVTAFIANRNSSFILQ